MVVFTNMLAHADAEGWVDIHPRAIAEETGLTIEQVNSAVHELESPDPDSRSPEEEGRRIIRLDEHRAWGWRVVNHGKYRSIRSEEDRREQNRLAQERWRNKNKPSVSISKQDKPKQKQEAEVKESKPKDAGNVTVAVLLADGCSETHANELLSLRKKKRSPLTALAWNGIKGEIKKAGMSLDEGIGTMAARGWQSFEAAWVAQGKAQLSTVVPTQARTCIHCKEPAHMEISGRWYCRNHDQYSTSEAA